MRWSQTRSLFVLLLVLACGLSATAQQQGGDGDREELLRRLTALEQEVSQLRAAMATTDAARADGQGHLVAASLRVPAEGNDGASASALPAEKAAPAPTLSGLLGSTTFSGFVDLNYGFNFNQPTSRTSGLRSFDAPSSQFALNMVELVADRPAEATHRLGYHVALGFGDAMNAINASDPGGLGFAQYLKEAYLSYMAPVGSGLTIDFGKFVTPAGAEVIETKDDWNYSRGLLFSYAVPYYHFGARAKYTFNSKYSITGYLVNGWNDVIDNNTGKTMGVSFAWAPTKKWGLTQTYLAGPEGINTNSHWRQLSDTVLTYTPTGKLSLMANYDYGRGDFLPNGIQPVFWTGIGGYVRYALNPQYAVATRYEYYDDHDGFTTGTPQHLNEITETFERNIGHGLLARLEFRHDVSNAPVFFKGTTPVAGQTTFAAGMVYAFTSHSETQ